MDRLDELLAENKRLKEKLQSIETQPSPTTKSMPAFKDQGLGKVLKLLEQRDATLDEIATELQQKKLELEETIGRLEERNEQLQLWIATLSMYQQLLENEPYSIVGFNKDAKLVLYNRTAISLFGEAIKSWRMKEVEGLDFSAADPGSAAFVREILKSGQSNTKTITRGSKSVTTTGFLMGTQQEPTGVLLKITVIP